MDAGMFDSAQVMRIDLLKHQLEFADRSWPPAFVDGKLLPRLYFLLFAVAGRGCAIGADKREALPHFLFKIDMEPVHDRHKPAQSNDEIDFCFFPVAFPDAFEATHGEPFYIAHHVPHAEIAVVLEPVNPIDKILIFLYS